VLSTPKAALALHIDPLVAMNTSASDFTINDLVNYERPVSPAVMMSLHRMDVFADALSYMGGSGHKASRCLAGCPPDIKGNAVCHVGG
jgi:hypothetical protein